MAIFFQCALGEYYNHSLFSTCTEVIDIFEKWLWLISLRSSRYFWEIIVIVRLLCWRNTTIIHRFLLVAQKGLNILLRNNSDCNEVDLYNTRKRYAVIESLDLTRNISWLASCFSKIRNQISIVQKVKVRLLMSAFFTWYPIFILK